MPKLVRNTVIAGMTLMLLFMATSAYFIVKDVGRIVSDGLRLLL